MFRTTLSLDEIKKQETRLQNLPQEIKNLQERIAINEDTLATLKKKYAENQIDLLPIKNQELSSTISLKHKEITPLSERISTLQEIIKPIDQKINRLQKLVAPIETKLNQIRTLKLENADAEHKISKIQKKIDRNNDEINQNNLRLALLPSLIAGVNRQIEAARQEHLKRQEEKRQELARKEEEERRRLSSMGNFESGNTGNFESGNFGNRNFENTHHTVSHNEDKSLFEVFQDAARESELRNLEKEQSDLPLQTAKLLSTYNNLNTEIHNERHKINLNLNSIDNLQARLQSFDPEQKTNRTLDDLKNEISIHNHTKSPFDIERLQLVKDVEELQAEIRYLQKTIITNNKDLIDYQNQLSPTHKKIESPKKNSRGEGQVDFNEDALLTNSDILASEKQAPAKDELVKEEKDLMGKMHHSQNTIQQLNTSKTNSEHELFILGGNELITHPDLFLQTYVEKILKMLNKFENKNPAEQSIATRKCLLDAKPTIDFISEGARQWQIQEGIVDNSFTANDMYREGYYRLRGMLNRFAELTLANEKFHQEIVEFLSNDFIHSKKLIYADRNQCLERYVDLTNDIPLLREISDEQLFMREAINYDNAVTDFTNTLNTLTHLDKKLAAQGQDILTNLKNINPKELDKEGNRKDIKLFTTTLQKINKFLHKQYLNVQHATPEEEREFDKNLQILIEAHKEGSASGCKKFLGSLLCIVSSGILAVSAYASAKLPQIPKPITYAGMGLGTLGLFAGGYLTHLGREHGLKSSLRELKVEINKPLVPSNRVPLLQNQNESVYAGNNPLFIRVEQVNNETSPSAPPYENPQRKPAYEDTALLNDNHGENNYLTVPSAPSM